MDAIDLGNEDEDVGSIEMINLEDISYAAEVTKTTETEMHTERV